MKCKVLLICAATLMLLGAASVGGAVQLLVNPGFEEGHPSWNSDSCGGELEIAGWIWSTLDPAGPPYNCSGFWSGTANWGPGNGGGPTVRSGADSVRAFNYAGYYTAAGWTWSSLRQTVEVMAGQDYTASAWVFIYHDWAYPMDPGIYSKLEVTELDSSDAVVAGPHTVSLGNDPANTNAWKLMSVQFRTTDQTAKVVFMLSEYWPEPRCRTKCYCLCFPP